MAGKKGNEMEKELPAALTLSLCWHYLKSQNPSNCILMEFIAPKQIAKGKRCPREIERGRQRERERDECRVG